MTEEDYNDPLIGHPVSEEDQRRAWELSEWAESDDLEISDDAIIYCGAEAQARAEAMFAKMGILEAVDAAIARARAEGQRSGG